MTTNLVRSMRGALVASTVLSGALIESLFLPTDLANLVGWWDFSDPATITLNGSDVSQIDDKSGKEHHAAQGTEAAQPAYITPGQNGLNTADFVAASSQVLITGGSESFAVETGDMYLAVGVDIDLSVTNQMIFTINHPTWIGFGPNDSSNHPRIWDGGGFKTFSSLIVGIGTPKIIEWWRSGTALTCRVNKVADTDGLTSSTNWRSNQVIGLGARNDGSFGKDGEGFEIIFCDELPSLAQRNACADYLMSKWGI